MSRSARKLRAALVGAGRMGARTDERTRAILHPGWLPLSHAESIRSNPELEFVAICDTNEKLRNWAVREYNVAGSYSDYREMIERERPDLLAIATRTPGRCEIVEFAAKEGVRGMHVEKPLGNTVEEVRRSLAAVKDNKVKITYGAVRRHMDAYRQAKQMVADGAIGDLEEIRINFGRSCLMWTHPHSIDLILYYGSSAKVRAVQGACIIPGDSVQGLTIDDDPILEWGVLELANGINGVISSAPGLTVDLIGKQGILSIIADGISLELRQMDPSGYLRPGQLETVSHSRSGTQGAFDELTRAVRAEPAKAIDQDELLDAQLALFALAQSSLQDRTKVDPATLDDRFTITGRRGEKYS